MSHISVQDIQRDPAGFLHRVEAGESLTVLSGERPIAEVTPLQPQYRGLRPWGLAAGEFEVPADFDVPLPDNVIDDFEGR